MKQRNGLFSDPISLAVGDVYHVPVSRKRDRRGNVPIKPKNFLTWKLKNGKSDQALFSRPAYNGIHDPYEEPCKSLKLRPSLATKGRARPFTAGGRVRHREPNSFLKNKEIEKENRREGAGNVRLNKPNFLTSKSKVGGGNTTPGVCIGGNRFKYVEDDYDREKDRKRENSRKHQQKIGKPFSSTVRQRNTFTMNEQCYSVQGLTLKLKKELYNYEKVKHPEPFKPSHPAKKGHNKTLQAFPKYSEDPGRKLAAKSTKHFARQTGYWKPTKNFASKPWTTITGHQRNQRKINYSRFY